MSNDLRFDHYFPYEELTQHVHALAGRRPDLISVSSIGKSFEGRDIWLAAVTNSATGPAGDKPAFWIDGNIHATEVSAASACLYFLNKLVNEYGSNPEITRCLDSRAFYIVPRVNPDGAELFFADKQKFIRSSTRPYPYDEEAIEGLKNEDIDGDGRFLQMRVPDPNGAWKKHPDEPRLLIRRDPTEVGGEYFRVLPEGALENWDGTTIKIQRNKEGLDLNRNFPGHWRQEHEQGGAGPFPTSEPEVHALAAFITSHPNICGGVTFHTFSGVLLRPYGAQSDEAFPAEDLWTFQAIGKKGKELTGYPDISVFHDFKYHPKEVITGVFDDWMYDHLGCFAWTVEIWSPHREAGLKGFGPDKPEGGFKFIDWFRDHPVEDDLAMLKWSDEKLGGKGYVEWHPFEHPQLGKIEIGGWDAIYAFRNPPPQFLEAEIARFPEWLLWHALISPELAISSASVEPLGEGAFKLTVVVDNLGWLPTYVTKKALENKLVRPVIAEIELPEGAFLKLGQLREELDQLEGKAYKPASGFGWNADATEERAKVEWVISGGTGTDVKITVRHERAGTVRKTVRLTGSR